MRFCVFNEGSNIIRSAFSSDDIEGSNDVNFFMVTIKGNGDDEGTFTPMRRASPSVVVTTKTIMMSCEERQCVCVRVHAIGERVSDTHFSIFTQLLHILLLRHLVVINGFAFYFLSLTSFSFLLYMLLCCFCFQTCNVTFFFGCFQTWVFCMVLEKIEEKAFKNLISG
uniref:Uncharacterized protein n=1 Tax=Manihot esculenta TaxID=3983 RepID=A0A199U9S5_MANES